jgi:flagellar protein FlaJ
MIDTLLGEGYRRRIGEWIRYSGSKATTKGFANYAFAFSLCIGFFIGLFARQYFIIAFPAGFACMFLLMHGFLILAVERRTRFVENILPDALQLMAANSRAGYIPSRALLLSARKEFGPLADAIKNVGKDIATGESMEDSLERITKYIRSELLGRTVKLINEGIRSGGQFASLMEENADDIRRVQGIKNEMRANVMMYTIFIAFAGCVGAPVLYALSGFLIGTISDLGRSISIPASSSVKTPFMKFGGLDLSPEFLLLFSVFAMIITTVGGSIIVGLISSGKEKNGIKYIPIFVTLAFLIFFMAQMFVAGMFGTLRV